MRTIGMFIYQNEALRFAAYLKRQGILNTCDGTLDVKTGLTSYQIWVHDEDRLKEARNLFEKFQKNPTDPEFDSPLIEEPSVEEEEKLEEEPPPPVRKFVAHFTNLMLVLCTFVFFLQMKQELPMLEEGIPQAVFSVTPIQAKFLYDLPPFFEQLVEVIQKHKIAPNQKVEQLPPEIQADLAQIPQVPFWRGLYDWVLLKLKTGDTSEAEGPLFIKLREGEGWRLFTPCILHGGLLHILFNMLWLWFLGRPIEQRLGFFRTLLLTVVVAIGSNTAQYFMGGPFFIGYSGVVMGLAGFSWSREKIAPWEGYPLSSSTLLFLVLFVAAMFALQAISFFVQLLGLANFEPNIANTAHISGAVFGVILGRASFFAQRAKR